MTAQVPALLGLTDDLDHDSMVRFIEWLFTHNLQMTLANLRHWRRANGFEVD